MEGYLILHSTYFQPQMFLLWYFTLCKLKPSTHIHQGMKQLSLAAATTDHQTNIQTVKIKPLTPLSAETSPIITALDSKQNIFCPIVSGIIIQLTNSSPNVLKVTLITCPQCPELLSAWWLMTLSLRQYCFNMISNRETWTANNVENKLESNLWMKHRTLTSMQLNQQCTKPRRRQS